MIQHLDKLLLSANATPEEIDRFFSENQFPLVQKDGVTFVYRGAAEAVDLRHWVYGLPANIPLNRLGKTDVWFRTLEFPDGSRIEYKFGVRKGGHEQWVHDPLNQDVANDPFGGNSVIRYYGYVEPDWCQHNQDVPKGKIEVLSVDSPSLGGKRIVPVYLPANFRDYRRYRLLVVHDGDDYVRYSSMQLVLDNLIHRLEIPPLIVAFSNPEKRLVEYANDKRHADHIVEELLPAIEKDYPVIQESSGRCLMGASFGAVASLSTAWRHPGVFDSLLLQSGSFAFTDIGEHSRSPVFDSVVEFMNQFRENPGKPSTRMFISCGVFESLIYENRSMVPFLQSHGVEVKYAEAYDGHNWENWRDRLRDGLTWIFPGPLWVTYM